MFVRSSRKAPALMLAMATLLALPGAAVAAVLQRGDDALTIALKTDGSVADTASFQGGADVIAAVGSLSADLGASVQTGRSLLDSERTVAVAPVGASSTWRGSALTLAAKWQTDVVQFAVNASRNNKQSSWAPDTPSVTPILAAITADDERLANVSATLKPLRTIDFQVGAQSSWSSIEAGSGVRAEQGSGTNSVYSTVKWSPNPVIAVVLGTKLGRDGFALQSDRSVRGGQTSVQPSLTATIEPVAGMQWRFAAERVVVPLSLSQLAEVAGEVDVGAVGLRPEGEWRLEGGVQQRLSDALTLSTGLTFADQDNANELAPTVGGGQSLTSVAAGSRQQVDLGLAADLKQIGLNGATLTGKGTWRRSEVEDPLTGLTRRASGESAYEGRLVFAQALPIRRAHWGIDGYVTGPSQFYGVSDSTHIASTAGLGGFIDYTTGPVQLKFRIDNLVGGSRVSRTDYYDGLRGSSDISRFDRNVDDGRAVSLSLSSRI